MCKWMRSLSLFGAPIILTVLVAAQSKYEEKTIVVNGHSGSAMVYLINGKSYVALESLARIGNGSMGFQGDRIVLTLPGAGAAAAHPADHPAQGMTDSFVRAALHDVAAIKEWTDTAAHAIQGGVPGDLSRLAPLHDRAAHELRLAQVAASSDADHSALPLLTNHFNLMNSWNDKLVAERKRMDTAKYSMNPNALANDETYQKITACAKFLKTMLPGGHFQDDRSCH